jgi:hypothetical protein
LDDLLLHPQFVDQEPVAVVPCKVCANDFPCTVELDALAARGAYNGLPANQAGV